MTKKILLSGIILVWLVSALMLGVTSVRYLTLRNILNSFAQNVSDSKDLPARMALVSNLYSRLMSKTTSLSLISLADDNTDYCTTNNSGETVCYVQSLPGTPPKNNADAIRAQGVLADLMDFQYQSLSNIWDSVAAPSYNPFSEDTQTDVGLTIGIGTGENSGDDGTDCNRGEGLLCGGAIKNGFPNTKQSDNPWGNKKYGDCNEAGNKGTIAIAGCGPTSMSQVLKYYNKSAQPSPMVENLIGRSTDPESIAKLSVYMGDRKCGSGSSHDLPKDVALAYGLKPEQTNNWESAESALLNGNPVVLTVPAGSPFTEGGHFITAIGISGDRVYFSDTGTRNITSAPISTTRKWATSITIIRP